MKVVLTLIMVFFAGLTHNLQAENVNAPGTPISFSVIVDQQSISIPTSTPETTAVIESVAGFTAFTKKYSLDFKVPSDTFKTHKLLAVLVDTNRFIFIDAVKYGDKLEQIYLDIACNMMMVKRKAPKYGYKYISYAVVKVPATLDIKKVIPRKPDRNATTSFFK